MVGIGLDFFIWSYWVKIYVMNHNPKFQTSNMVEIGLDFFIWSYWVKIYVMNHNFPKFQLVQNFPQKQFL